MRFACAVSFVALVMSYAPDSECNPDAKRLYDDLLSNYNRLIRPVSNNTHTVLVKLGLRLSQLIELVRIDTFSLKVKEHRTRLFSRGYPCSMPGHG